MLETQNNIEPSADFILKMGRELNLAHLSDQECEQILLVIQRDFDLRESEKARLGKIEEDIKETETKSKILAKESFDNSYCIRCFSTFIPLFRRKHKCVECKYNVCKNCCKVVDERLKESEYICKVCRRNQLLHVQSCDWFYENVRKRFKRFGSAKIVRSLYRRKSESDHESEVDSGYDPNSLASGISRKRRPSLQGVFSNNNSPDDKTTNWAADLKEKDEVDSRVPPVPQEHKRPCFEDITEERVNRFHDDLELVLNDVKNHLLTCPDVHDGTWDEVFQKYRPLLAKQLDDLTHNLRDALLAEFESSSSTPESHMELKEQVVLPIQKIVDSQVEVFIETDLENKVSGIDSTKHSEFLASAILEKILSDHDSELAIERSLAENQFSKPTSSHPVHLYSHEGEQMEELIVPVSKAGEESSLPPSQESSVPLSSLPHRESMASVTSEIYIDLESIQNRPMALPSFGDEADEFGGGFGTQEVDPDMLSLGVENPQMTSTGEFSTFSNFDGGSPDDDDLENLASASQTWENESMTSSTASLKGDNWFFRGSKVITPYDNLGTKKVGGDSRDSTLMFVPGPRNIPSPQIGDRPASEMSDNSSLGISDSEDTETEEGPTKAPLTHQSSNPLSDSCVQTDDLDRLQRYTDTESGIHGETDSEIHSVSSNEEKIKARMQQEVVENGFEADDPKFVVKPTTVTVPEGEVALFSCKVTGTAPIDVFWYREETEVKQLEESDKYDMYYKDGSYCMEVYNVTHADIGQYMCIVVNELADSYWTFGMKIKDNPMDKKAPEFIKSISDREVKEGQFVQFQVKVKGIPPPRVSWYKDGRYIKKNDESCRIEKRGNRLHTMTLDYATLDDDAEYMVVARNVVGEVKETADLSVDSRPLLAKTSPPVTLPTKVTPRKEAPSVSRIKELMDSVVKTQQDITVEAEDMLSTADKMSDLNQQLDLAEKDLNKMEDEALALTAKSEADDIVEENISASMTRDEHSEPAIQWEDDIIQKVDDHINNNSESSADVLNETEEEEVIRHYDEMLDSAATIRDITDSAVALASSTETLTEDGATVAHDDGAIITEDRKRKLSDAAAPPMSYDQFEKMYYHDGENELEEDDVMYIKGVKRLNKNRHRRDFNINHTPTKGERYKWNVQISPPIAPEVTKGTLYGPGHERFTNQVETYSFQVHSSEVKATELLSQIERLEEQVRETSDVTDEQHMVYLQDQVALMISRVHQNETVVQEVELTVDRLAQLAEHLTHLQETRILKTTASYQEEDMSDSRPEWDGEQMVLPSVSKLKAQFNDDSGSFIRVGSITGRSIPKEKRDMLKQLSTESLPGPVRKIQDSSVHQRSPLNVPTMKLSPDHKSPRTISPIPEDQTHDVDLDRSEPRLFTARLQVDRSPSPMTVIVKDLTGGALESASYDITHSDPNLGAVPPQTSAVRSPTPRRRAVITSKPDSFEDSESSRSRSSSVGSSTSSGMRKQVSGALLSRVAFWDTKVKLRDDGMDSPSKLNDSDDES